MSSRVSVRHYAITRQPTTRRAKGASADIDMVRAGCWAAKGNFNSLRASIRRPSQAESLEQLTPPPRNSAMEAIGRSASISAATTQVCERSFARAVRFALRTRHVSRLTDQVVRTAQSRYLMRCARTFLPFRRIVARAMIGLPFPPQGYLVVQR